jgi:hypothetical protein
MPFRVDIPVSEAIANSANINSPDKLVVWLLEMPYAVEQGAVLGAPSCDGL